MATREDFVTSIPKPGDRLIPNTFDDVSSSFCHHMSSSTLDAFTHGYRVHIPSTFRTLAILSVTLLFLAACGSEDSSGLDDDISAETVLANASQRMADTESMRFDMRVQGETYIDEGRTIRLIHAFGELARPDMVSVEFQIEVLGAQTVSIRMISVGQENWTTDIVTGRWVEAPPEFGYDPSVLYDNQEGLGPVVGKILNPDLLGTEEINGRQAYHIRGSSSGETIAPMTNNTMHGDDIGIDVWIDGASWDILRVIVDEPEGPQAPNPATWTMNLTDHNEPVTIEPPV